MRSEEVWVEASSMENKAGGRMVLGVIVSSKGGRKLEAQVFTAWSRAHDTAL